VEDVSVHYASVAALDAVSLAIAPGEAVAFVGPSGAGKTTLLRCLNGTIRPTSGRIVLGDGDMSDLKAEELRHARRCIGFVHQSLGLVPNLRVLQNVIAGRLGDLSFFGSLRAMLRPRQVDVARAHQILERVGIPDKLYERTDRLSGGQQQRVAIARALYQEPKILLADEPVSSVDPARARDTVRLLADISREEALTLCMSLHDLELAREYFPRLVGMRNGRVAFDRPTEEITTEEFGALYELERHEILADGA
jgi:phosphonate transport system ATP-binding protein